MITNTIAYLNLIHNYFAYENGTLSKEDFRKYLESQIESIKEKKD